MCIRDRSNRSDSIEAGNHLVGMQQTQTWETGVITASLPGAESPLKVPQLRPAWSIKDAQQNHAIILLDKEGKEATRLGRKQQERYSSVSTLHPAAE